MREKGRERTLREKERNASRLRKLLSTKVLARESVGEHHHQEHTLLSHSRGEREKGWRSLLTLERREGSDEKRERGGALK